MSCSCGKSQTIYQSKCKRHGQQFKIISLPKPSVFNYDKVQAACATVLMENEEGNILIGSGFFVRANGYLVTNYHVVENATQIWAHINNVNGLKNNPKFYQCQMVGSDRAGDITVLKVIPNDGDPPLTKQGFLNFGNSIRSTPGQEVYMVGDPFSVDYVSVSKGVIRDNRYTELFFFPDEPPPPGWPFSILVQLQQPEALIVDASIIPGNSGSPIVDKDCRILGIASYTIGDETTFGGGMAQTIMEKVVNEIIKTQTDYVKGYMGISILPMDSAIIYLIGGAGFLEPEGYFVFDVDPNGPLATAGILGDILLKVNGERVGINFRNAGAAFNSWRGKPGQKVICEFLFSGVIEITLGVYPAIMDFPFGVGGVANPRKRMDVVKQILTKEVVDKFRTRLANLKSK